jgi:hypothetical protein
MSTMNTMTYRNDAARIDQDPDDRIFVGHLAGIRDIVGSTARGSPPVSGFSPLSLMPQKRTS